LAAFNFVFVVFVALELFSGDVSIASTVGTLTFAFTAYLSEVDSFVHNWVCVAAVLVLIIEAKFALEVRGGRVVLLLLWAVAEWSVFRWTSLHSLIV
jgi:hypothetical protein